MSKMAGSWQKILKKKKTLLILGIVVAGAGLISFRIYSVKGASAKGTQNQELTVQETQAKTGSISNSIVGTGNLELGEGTNLTIPSGIIVEEIKVESGDVVSKGDVLAVVNQTSVLRAMEDIQEQIEDLDEEIEESKDDTSTKYIKSKVDGRIKKIFVQEGQKVTECMVEQGALMLLSIDGYLAVEIETDAELAAGDTVTVIRSDGSQKEGTVESISGKTCMVLCSDSGVGIEEQVTVADSQGNTLGTGSTRIHQQLAVTATAGTVEDLCVSEDQTVYTGTTLFTVNSGGQSLEYQEQMAKRQELTEILQKLMELSESGTITAKADGIIQSVNISAEGSQNEEEAGSLQISKNTATVVGSAAAETENPAEKQEQTEKEEQVENQEEAGEQREEGNQERVEKQGEEESQEQEGEGKQEALLLEITDSGKSGKSVLVLETPRTGAKPQTKIKAEDGSYEGTVSWKPADKVFAEKTSYQASVALYAGEGYSFTEESISKVKAGVLSGVTLSEDGKSLSMQITYPFTESEIQNNDMAGNGIQTEQGEDAQNNNAAGNGGQTEQGTGVQNQGENIQNGSGNAINTGSTGSTVSSGSTSTGSVSAQTSSGEDNTGNADSDSEVAAFTLAAADTMVLSVNVDELDINSVTEGQQAVIMLDAVEGENFAGTVTKVGSSASSSSGGVAKYTVKISIPRDERMKEGMNASATITIEERENVVTIPVNALQERGNHIFVYTETDSEGNLSGEQEVSTGLSDGNMVEITEGISEGEMVYYLKTGNTSQQSFGGMENGPGGNMGEMPQGGPQGDMGNNTMPGRESGGDMPNAAPGRQE